MSNWKFDSSKPIFRQICDRIKSDVASGKYAGGDKFPSVRELAVDIGVNPNTVQRALAELETEGILKTKRGDGRYLSGDAGLSMRLTDDIASDACRSFAESMRSMGLSDDEIIASLKRELTKNH